MSKIILSFLLFLFVTSLSSHAQIAGSSTNGPKIAMVVGVGEYKIWPILHCPPNDAEDVATKLTGLGYKVIKLINPSGKEFDHSIDSLKELLKGASICVFYYSGHGFDLSGESYLIFSDAQDPGSRTFYKNICTINRIIKLMYSSTCTTSLLFFDGCRKEFRLDALDASFRKWQPKETSPYPRNFLLAYGCSPDDYCHEDTASRNSIFTGCMLKYIPVVNLSIDKLLNLVTRDVHLTTGDKQTPVKFSNMEYDFCFCLDSVSLVYNLPGGKILIVKKYSYNSKRVEGMNHANTLNIQSTGFITRTLHTEVKPFFKHNLDQHWLIRWLKPCKKRISLQS